MYPRSLFTRIRRSGRLVVAITAVVALAACSGPTAPVSSGTGEEEVRSVRIAVTNNLVGLPLFAGVEQGIFAENGLDVTLNVVASGNDAARALQAGDVDFALASTVSLVAIRSGGVDVSLVVMTSGDATNASYDLGNGILARVDSGITKEDPQSLVGKTVATNVGGSPAAYLSGYLEAHSIAADDVEILNTPVPETVPALEQGLVDAIATVEPQLSAARLALGDNAVLISQLEGYTTAAVGLVAMADTIDGEAELVEKIVRSVAQAAQYTRQNADSAVQAALTYINGLEFDVARLSHEVAVNDPRISICTVQALEKGIEDALEAEQITQAIDPQDAIATQAIDALVQSEPALFDDLPVVPTSAAGCDRA